MTVLPFDKKNHENHAWLFFGVIFFYSSMGIYFNSKLLSMVIHADNGESEISEINIWFFFDDCIFHNLHEPSKKSCCCCFYSLTPFRK